ALTLPHRDVSVMRGYVALGSALMLGRAVLGALALAVMIAATAAPAAAGDTWQLNFYLFGPGYEGKLPSCESSSALDKIADRFRQKEGIHWNSDLKLVGFEQIRETGFRTWAPNAIPRRFCTAMVQISDGSRRPIHYSIIEESGMIGMTIGVEW